MFLTLSLTLVKAQSFHEGCTDTIFRIVRNCYWNNDVWSELFWDAWKIILLLLLGRASVIFQMTCSLGVLPQCCSVPQKLSFFGKNFALFPVTAFVEIIPFLTASRWAGLQCCRMLWFWLQAQHLSTFLLTELNFSVSACFSLCCPSFSPSEILFLW